MAKNNGFPDGVDGIEIATKLGNIPPLNFDDGTTKTEYKDTSITFNTGPEGVGKYLYFFTRYFTDGNPKAYGPDGGCQATLLLMDSIYTKEPNANKQQGNVFGMKHYWMDKSHPNMMKYAEEMDKSAAKGEGLLIEISWEDVEQLNIQPVTDRILVAQHKKEWILNCIFNMIIHFADIQI